MLILNFVLNYQKHLPPCHRHCILWNKFITSCISHQLTLDGEENELAGWWVYISNIKSQCFTEFTNWPHQSQHVSVEFHMVAALGVSREHDSAYGGVLGATEGLLRSAAALLA